VGLNELDTLVSWMRARGVQQLRCNAQELGLVEIALGPEPEPLPGEPEAFGIPEALMKAKDDEAARLQAERDAQWAEDQVRYAHTTGYVEEAPEARATRDHHG
jgi:hypothetical protein